MKNLILCTILLYLLVSCSSDSESNATELDKTAINESGRIAPEPENKENPFDYKGKKFYDVLIGYQKQNHYPNSSADLTNQIIFMASHIKERTEVNRSIIPFTDEMVEDIMADPDNNMILIVQNSTLSTSAKSSLISFLEGLITQRQLSFSISYNYITDYEDTIIGNSSLNEDDSETILTITSISRYSLYSESERKDRDWDKSSGNKTAKSIFTGNDVSIISIIALLDIIS